MSTSPKLSRKATVMFSDALQKQEFTSELDKIAREVELGMLQIWSRKKSDEADDFFAPDVISHFSGKTNVGLETMKGHCLEILNTFDSFSVEVVKIIAYGEPDSFSSASEVLVKGVMDGNKHEFYGLSTKTVVNKKVTEFRLGMDWEPALTTDIVNKIAASKEAGK